MGASARGSCRASTCVHTNAGAALVSGDIGSLRPLADQHQGGDGKSSRTIRGQRGGCIATDHTEFTGSCAGAEPACTRCTRNDRSDRVVVAATRDACCHAYAVLAGLGASTDSTTSAAVVVVGLYVDTGVVAVGLTAAADDPTSSCDAALSAWTGVVAGSAVLGIGLVVNAGIVAHRRACGATADPCSARAACWTGGTTAATMPHVRLQIHTLPAASRLFRRAGQSALPVSANFTRCTGFCTGATVFVVAVEVDALSVAIGESSWARANAAGTGLSAHADRPAASAVSEIRFQVDATPATVALSAWANQCALAVETLLGGFAGCIAAPAMIDVSFGIYANAVAFGLVACASADPCDADLAAGTNRSASAAMGRVIL